MNALLNLIAPLITALRALLPWGQSVVLLYLRYFIAKAFFQSGMGKIANWENTLYAFQHGDDFKVPLLSPEFAAVMGTTGELVLPVLLMLGLFGRFGAAGLFVVNIVAAISLSAGTAETAIQTHIYWGMLIAVLIAFGPGRLALDTLIKRHGVFQKLALD